MKKILILAASLVLVIGILCGCSCSTQGSKELNNGKIQVVTTIFPQYDWVKNIVGENSSNVEVTLLQDSGVDLHSYQPTAQDILKLSTCDMFIYVGGESDEWVEDALKEASNKKMKVINLMDVLGNSVKDEEVVEGMQEDKEHEEKEHENKNHKEDSKDKKEHEVEKDEHIWLSLRNAKVLVQEIASKLGEIDSVNASIYSNNANSYMNKLQDLDNKYVEVTNNAPVKTLVFGDRFPFRYMTDDYNLNYYAAFVGCSAETEASFETISYLAQKIDELNLHSVMTIDGSDKSIANTIVQNTKDKNQQILTLNSMQSVNSNDIKNGLSYLSIMDNNLAVLKEALK